MTRPDAPDDMTLIGGVEHVVIRMSEYDGRWVARFEEHAASLCAALGSAALSVEHIGSTSVPGLAAKPIIDVVVVVADSADEAAYLPALEAAGYELRVREPGFHEHRMLGTPARDVHVHVYSRDCVEVRRCLDFRDHLRQDAEDRALYELTKRELAARDWPSMDAYATAKTDVVMAILARVTRWTQHTSTVMDASALDASSVTKP
ncbi:MAG TPA: GrpB family protein [Polyangiaceae bacterium]|nr:GrpB family protein [Polyangiaceae bacterium]